MVKVATLSCLPGADLGAKREMTVFGHQGLGFRPCKTTLSAQQVFPVEFEAEISQQLVEAVLRDDLGAVMECLADSFVDVNYAAGVSIKSRRVVVMQHEETADEVRIEYEELRTDVSALFLAAHSGNLQIARKLLVSKISSVHGKFSFSPSFAGSILVSAR